MERVAASSRGIDRPHAAVRPAARACSQSLPSDHDCGAQLRLLPKSRAAGQRPQRCAREHAPPRPRCGKPTRTPMSRRLSRPLRKAPRGFASTTTRGAGSSSLKPTRRGASASATSKPATSLKAGRVVSGKLFRVRPHRGLTERRERPQARLFGQEPRIPHPVPGRRFGRLVPLCGEVPGAPSVPALVRDEQEDDPAVPRRLSRHQVPDAGGA